MYGRYKNPRSLYKKGYKNKGSKKGYSKFGKKHGTKTVITKYRW